MESWQWPVGSYEIGFVSSFVCWFVGRSIHLSVHPSIQMIFWNCIISFFQILVVIRNHMKLCVTARFFQTKKEKRKILKIVQKLLKNRVSWIYWKLWPLIFFLNLVYNESLYYFLFSCTDPTNQENLVPEIWAKVF